MGVFEECERRGERGCDITYGREVTGRRGAQPDHWAREEWEVSGVVRANSVVVLIRSEPSPGEAIIFASLESLRR